MWIEGKDFDFEKHEGRLVAFLSLWPVSETKRLQVGMIGFDPAGGCLLYTSPSPRDRTRSRMPSSA